jgi:hypothetical protein
MNFSFENVFFSVISNFEKYAIVRALSVRLSVCATTFQGVARLGRFMGQSVAYDPRA